jgi:hypothetical protein
MTFKHLIKLCCTGFNLKFWPIVNIYCILIHSKTLLCIKLILDSIPVICYIINIGFLSYIFVYYIDHFYHFKFVIYRCWNFGVFILDIKMLYYSCCSHWTLFECLWWSGNLLRSFVFLWSWPQRVKYRYTIIKNKLYIELLWNWIKPISPPIMSLQTKIENFISTWPWNIAVSLLTGFISLFFNIMPGQDYFIL